MVTYDLSHLTQNDDQTVVGPIQDDEALFLFALIRCTRISRILEVGGLDGYSARNFLEALESRPDTFVYTIDLQPVTQHNIRHICIQKDAREISPEDVDNRALDLVFFDCHEMEVQMELYHRLRDSQIITNDTILALHDTGLHESKFTGWSYEIPEGWVHQPVERQMVNRFKDFGYDVMTIDAKKGTSCGALPYRHGLTICKKHTHLNT